MARVVVLMLDSLGIGASVDADRFGDDGADTFGHIATACAQGDADRPGERSGALAIPNLSALGLAHAAANSRGQWPDGLPVVTPIGAWGYAVESSRGKDTPSGHWEMAGLPVGFDWGYFPETVPCFPSKLVDRLIAEGNLSGVLGNCHASGTAIIDELGEEHIASGAPIIYTSADSVFQIAAHEEYFGLDKLYALCDVARWLVDEWQIARVIARPFTGSRQGTFQRTGNRRDLTTPPHAPTLLDRLTEDGGEVISVGKVGDIFAGRGISKTIKADGNHALFDATMDALTTARDHTLIFTNFVDFDMLYGHRRDVTGYALALEAFDRRLPELQACIKTNDLVLATADHGCDPTYPGHDHTREHVPVLVSGPHCCPAELGERQGFADMGQTLAAYFGLNSLNNGTSFLNQITLESSS